MLLAVFDLARAGGLTENRILYAPPLLERFRRFFEALRAPGDHPNRNRPVSTVCHCRERLRKMSLT